MNSIVAYGKYYWTPGYNWLRRNYLVTTLDAQISHKGLVQVFTMQNKIQSLINDGCQKNAIFQDCYKNLMILCYDESHLAEGTMSPQKSTFNRFNGFLGCCLENIVRKPCFGRWISESIPYGLASTNTKALQLLAKAIVTKLDNEEYLPKQGWWNKSTKYISFCIIIL